ncbi:ABC transporter permease [Adhaeribacter soli]|uniref:FtsX-like permease family protein n=1 Tax=Adhaeribacter soli TaxID=2607655 RepID=A0A5N1J3C9_9BACT|nr:ABC transporter permease [Adhaeribacter soli]KAA9341026.1 FtsX-like permease family protein [Adhaeribacter soli]
MLKTALRFMIYDKAKTIGALLGVVIANFLIGQQSGIFIFLTNAMSALVDNTPTGLWIVDENTTNVNALGQIDVRTGRQAESIPGVAKAYPYVVSGGSAKFKNGKSFGVLLIGSEPPYFKGGPWNLMQGSTFDLLRDYAITTEYFDRESLGGTGYGDDFEINGHRVEVVAQTRGARGFGAAYVFTTIARARAIGNVPENKVNAYLVDLKPGANPDSVRNAINRHIYGVRAWTPEEFSKATVKTVLGSSGIAISTGSLIAFAVVSGLVIIGLTLYSAAVDRIKDYATIKAIGADNSYIWQLILTQALLIATVGYLVGSLLLEGFRYGISTQGAIFNFSLLIRAGFLFITLIISVGGAFFAIRRITKAEPASVFRA